jgi:hypothetical protein
MSGRGARRSWRTKTTNAGHAEHGQDAEGGRAAMPQDGASLRASRPAVTATARVHEPVQSSCAPRALGEPHGRRPIGPTRQPLTGPGRHPFGIRVGTLGGCDVEGSTTTASTAAMAIRGSSPQNRARHPKYWMIGAPMVTPRTGPPGPDQRPPAHGLDPVLVGEGLEDQGHRGRAGGRPLDAVEQPGGDEHPGRRGRGGEHHADGGTAQTPQVERR